MDSGNLHSCHDSMVAHFPWKMNVAERGKQREDI